MDLVRSLPSVKLKHHRLLSIVGGLFCLGLCTFFTLRALQDSLIYFYRPSELPHKKITALDSIRVGGRVVPHSLSNLGKGLRFRITDGKANLWIVYYGVLPDLFREGQEIVAEGYLQDPNVFQARSVLAKHDETYRPKGGDEQGMSLPRGFRNAQ